MSISGDNFQFSRKRTTESYYFSRYNHIWGWATWRRAWKYYDVNVPLWDTIRDGDWLEGLLDSSSELKTWQQNFQQVHDGKIDTWDYQWVFACWIQNGLTVLPNINLISNIGFGEGATHTKNEVHKFANLPVESMSFPLAHPKFVLRDTKADKYFNDTGSIVSILRNIIINFMKK